ncbi:hypothetical protein UFOVP367_41 [uncultured Caudovirales phage]|uniref:Uncharacterized protein n=1 Tax=uncultured Caudovirales phage TaxID=2100421 RepID=A0A6J7WYE9_9CAUD|nr:hypothetical protein UFOVP367_41 [uncultured Caudovirales phage]
MDNDPIIRNLYGYPIHTSAKELMQAESRRTKVEALKRVLGEKYLLAPLTKKLDKPLK